jgi:alpha-mannosidase
MQRHENYTRWRIQQQVERIRDLIYADHRPVQNMQVAGPVDRIGYAEAMKLAYRPCALGEQFGPPWSTFWFQLRSAIPQEWAGQRVDLLWNTHSEGTLWIEGRSIQGLNGAPKAWTHDGRPDAMILEQARGGETVELAVEMACNRIMGLMGWQADAPRSDIWLAQADLARLDRQAWDLYHDYLTLQSLEQEQVNPKNPLDKTWGGLLLSELNRFCNLFDAEDRSTWASAGEILKNLLRQRNAQITHHCSAIGHAHIDTAWLWPLAETYRKCVRTFSTQTRYMDQYPEYKFSCSQAQQYAWIKERNPDLYQRIMAKVKTGQWVPVGGTWVEPDCNIPAGESLCRQFLVGQRFFEAEFGKRCREFWNPDVFGYNGQLPQIMNLAGIRRFLTQKLCWNTFNPPHTQTFNWQGIDGSEVLAHFPPADTYNAQVQVAELRRQAFAYHDTDRSRHGLLLFGHGDGGGGPTLRMLEQLRRVGDLLGVPPTQTRSSDDFFELLEQDCTDRLTVIGELYFELHRGTYTTQAAVKAGNRRAECLLHDAEFLAASATALGAAEYPAAELDRLWQLTLLNQFHDILPGSSIGLVYEEARRDHAEVAASADRLRQTAAAALVGALARGDAGGSAVDLPVNTIGAARAAVTAPPQGALAYVEAPAYGVGHAVACPDKVSVQRSEQTVVLENRHLRAVLNTGGALVSLVHKATGRETLAGPADLELYRDDPIQHEAWDVEPQDLETAKPCPPAESCTVSLDNPLRAEVTLQRRIGRASSMTQVVRLDAAARSLEFHNRVDWHENRKWLKAAFPVTVRAMSATYEMPFGNFERPTHYNTSFDIARFEVPGHKWMDLSEHGFGVSVLNDCKYGFSTLGHTMHISLLRATKSPDPQADMGLHHFAYAVYPHAGGWREAGTVAEALAFNIPLLWSRGSARAAAQEALLTVDDPNLVLDTVKRSEDGKGTVLRLYEAHGARGTARVQVALPFLSAAYCNILEDTLGPAKVTGGNIEVPYGPYKVISLKLV